ncbi:unnamed protein product [Rotaria magnacalcarata]|uniref:Uncharacterized protein n=4 Tax=Rotaria magnacalcarata TaxID=392030 RepID=A0A815VTF1_9BILA|nr:unnamed protein product [Rotaria magnacalcarata]CAF4574697.1 unnamed protein product [Rotaria magnacalcarata]
MMTDLDLRSVEVDLNGSPIVKTEPSPIQLETTDYSKYLRKLAGVNVSSVKWTIICIALDLIYTMILLGMSASNQSSCPIEPRIPIYLIVYSSVSLVSIATSIVACIMHYQKYDQSLNGFYYVHCSAIIIITIQLFNYIWLMVGSVWVFRVYKAVQYTENNQPTYCQQSIYQFGIIVTVLNYIFSFTCCYCKILPWKV